MAAYSDFSVPFYGVTLLTYSVFAQPLPNLCTTPALPFSGTLLIYFGATPNDI